MLYMSTESSSVPGDDRFKITASIVGPTRLREVFNSLCLSISEEGSNSSEVIVSIDSQQGNVYLEQLTNELILES